MKLRALSRLTALPLCLLASPEARTAGPAPPRALSAFVGEWSMSLMAEPETFGERGGPGAGTMTCAWGPNRVWVDCVMDSEYEGLGPYLLKVVLYETGDPEIYGAFVTNSFGGGRLYLGRWASETQLIYRDAWVDPSRKWEHQLTTYTFDRDGGIRFLIEVSSDGETYRPHSSGTYRRAGSR